MSVKPLEEAQAEVVAVVAQLDEIIKQQGIVRVAIVSLLILSKALITFWVETQEREGGELAEAQHQHEKILFKAYLKKAWNGSQSMEIREILPVKPLHQLISLKVTMTWDSV